MLAEIMQQDLAQQLLANFRCGYSFKTRPRTIC